MEGQFTLWLINEITGLFARISNNIFFLLTGWFFHKTKFTVKRIMVLLGNVIFVNWILLLINLFIYEDNDMLMLLMQVFPISSDMNWFVTAYFAIYMLGPFIQKCMKYLRGNPQVYNIFIGVIFLLFGLIGFITPTSPYHIGIIIGIYIVFVGDYIEFNKAKIATLPIRMIGIVCFSLLVIIRYVLDIYLSKIIPELGNYSGHFEGNLSPLITSIAICILILFSKLSINLKPINYLACSTLTCYLIHDNEAFKNHLWIDIFKVGNHINHIYLYMLFCVIGIYVTCFLIDIVRKRTVEKVWLKAVSPFCYRIDRYISTVF